MSSVRYLLSCIMICVISVSGQYDKIPPGVIPDARPGEVRFGPPTLNEEDEHSWHIPDSMKCDACRILTYRMSQAFQDAEKKKRAKQKLTESEVLDALDKVCTDKFESTGVKEVDGEKRLSSKGLETFDSPGIMQGGGMWPGRLQQLCGKYSGDIGEEEIYAAFRKDNTLDRFMCHGRGLRSYCKAKRPTKTEL